MFIYYTESKPFSFNCKTNNIKAIASLVGGKKLLQMYKKYRYNNIEQIDFFKEVEENP